MSEYTFETAALKAVTIDAVKYNEEGLRNSITPETIQAVVPIAWDETSVVFGEGAINRSTRSVLIGASSSSSPEAYHDVVGVGKGTYVVIESVAVGSGAKGYGRGTAVGCSSTANQFSVAVGRGATAYLHGISIGAGAAASNTRTLAVGEGTIATPDTSMTIGCAFSDTAGSYTCTTEGTGSITIGAGANTKNNGDIESSNSVTIGCKANTTAPDSVTLGAGASNTNSGSIVIGSAAKSEGDKALTITLGSQFTEITDNGDVVYPCSTEGTGSITIGAGANTLNMIKIVDGVETTVESSNAVTIGCKAENKGADSVVIGAGASNEKAGCIVIGSAARQQGSGDSVAIGTNSLARGIRSTAVGNGAQALDNGVSIGAWTKGKGDGTAVGGIANAEYQACAFGQGANAKAIHTIAIGCQATVSDYGATVIRSTAEDGTITQLYFSGANTPLADAWEDGEAMMGYVVTDKDGNVMMDAQGNALVGTQKLSVLFPNNRGENAFTPAALNLDEGWTPKPMFRPSDLDLPIEEPEVEEPENIEPTKPLVYKPQLVYPIVEPEIEEINE